MLDKLNQIKSTAAPEQCKSDRSYSPLSSARNIRNLLSTTTPHANTHQGRTKSTSVGFNTFKSQKNSGMLFITKFLSIFAL